MYRSYNVDNFFIRGFIILWYSEIVLEELSWRFWNFIACPCHVVRHVTFPRNVDCHVVIVRHVAIALSLGGSRQSELSSRRKSSESQSSTRGVGENCLRSSSGSCLPKKRTFVGHWTVGALTLNFQFNLKRFFVE